MKKLFILLLFAFVMSSCMTPRLETKQRTVYVYDDVYHYKGYPYTYYGYPMNPSLTFILESKTKPRPHLQKPVPHRRSAVKRGR